MDTNQNIKIIHNNQCNNSSTLCNKICQNNIIKQIVLTLNSVWMSNNGSCCCSHQLNYILMRPVLTLTVNHKQPARLHWLWRIATWKKEKKKNPNESNQWSCLHWMHLSVTKVQSRLCFSFGVKCFCFFIVQQINALKSKASLLALDSMKSYCTQS